MQWLSPKEKHQAGVFKALVQGRLTLAQARAKSGLPESTFYRRLRRYRQGGALALAHRLRHKPSHRAYHRLRRWALGTYAAAGPLSALAFYRQHVRPYFALAYGTVRRWLRQAGVLPSPFRPWKRRAPRPLIPKVPLRHQPPCNLARPMRQLSRRQREEKKLRRWLGGGRYEVLSPPLRRATVRYIQRTRWIPKWRRGA